MNELNAWSYTNETTIIEHILARYHQVHRYQLQNLVQLAEKVSAVHTDVFPSEILPLLRQTQQDLLDHMLKEERVLFPMILNGAGIQARMPIQVMRHEHDEHQHTLKRFAQLTQDFSAPIDACASWQRLYTELEEFCTDLHNHIVLENEILFPRVLSSFS